MSVSASASASVIASASVKASLTLGPRMHMPHIACHFYPWH
jgi:hypothetical protein